MRKPQLVVSPLRLWRSCEKAVRLMGNRQQFCESLLAWREAPVANENRELSENTGVWMFVS